MDLQHFFIFIFSAVGIPIAVALVLKSKSYSKKEVESLESGVKSFIRKTNRHKNNYFTLSILFSFLSVCISLLIMLRVHFGFGKENWPYLLMSCWILIVTIVGYLIARASGGIRLDD
ncbi:MAG: NADH-quinone oxidoreductase subunit A [Bacteriovoracaceae bacterium]|nr:NADH-quinone oxidoreductase subunit A [Bacteriovoracaceae bacterium]